MAILYSVYRFNPIAVRWVLSFQTKEMNDAYRHHQDLINQNYRVSILQAYVNDAAEFTEEDELREDEELRGER